MSKKKDPKKASFSYICENCTFYCNNKARYIEHLQTKKHNDTNDTKNHPNHPNHPKKTHFCSCGKSYKYKTGLYRHQKKCNYTHLNDTDNKNSENLIIKFENKSYENDTNKVIILENMVEKLIDQNSKLTESLQTTMETQNKTLCEIAKQPHIIQNNNNNSFNVMNYLNNDCKDALNLSDFIKTLQVNYDDLLKIRDNGYVYGMEKSIIENLIDLEETKRPIQCTDIKRKKFFIKDEEKWNIDEENKKINKALCDITTKHIKELQKWKLRNPDWMDNDSKFDIITDITCQILKGSSDNGEKLKKKVFEKLSKAVKINK